MRHAAISAAQKHRESVRRALALPLLWCALWPAACGDAATERHADGAGVGVRDGGDGPDAASACRVVGNGYGGNACERVGGGPGECTSIDATPYDQARKCKGSKRTYGCLDGVAIFNEAMGCFARTVDGGTQVFVTTEDMGGDSHARLLGTPCDQALYGEATLAPLCPEVSR